LSDCNKTIIYLTDNSLDKDLAVFCRKKLCENSKEIPIVFVSQKSLWEWDDNELYLEGHDNIVLGEIGRSWISLYKQILAGIEAAETDYIGIAEHDCLYTSEHLLWIPPKDDIFYYNHNCWLVQWKSNHPELDGMYSYWPKRFALSQLVCHKKLLKESTEEVLNLLEMGLKVEKGMRWYGEPGLVADTYRAFISASSGRPVQLQSYLEKYTTKYKSEIFRTEIPNLDIRHGSNFTGAKRGKQRTYELPYWGKFEELIR
jgi:hypothetical protein